MSAASDTPICDLIESLLSRGTMGQEEISMSRGTMGQIFDTARKLESAMTAKSYATSKDKREKERLRKAVYRANNVPRDNGTKQLERVLVVLKEDSKNSKLSKKDSPPCPAGQWDIRSDWPKDYREQFWSSYPRKTEKKAALAKLDALHRSGAVPWARFFDGVKRYCGYVAGTEERYIKHPATWLNRGCWDDEHGAKNGNGGHEVRTSTASGSEATRLDPIMAGMGNLASRIAERKLAGGSEDRTGNPSFDFAATARPR